MASTNAYSLPKGLETCVSSQQPSSSNFLYYVAFVDAYIKYTWIYFLKNKSEVVYA